MSNLTAKVSSNVFYKARQRASEHNERLKSRENAADIMSIDRGRLYRIESGVAVPYPEEIKMMCDLYGMPELQNYYCTEMCPLGCDIPKISAVTLDRVAIHGDCPKIREKYRRNIGLNTVDITQSEILIGIFSIFVHKSFQGIKKRPHQAFTISINFFVPRIFITLRKL